MGNPESQAEFNLVSPLDPSLLVLKDDQKEFLNAVIPTKNEEELRERILKVQKQAYDKYPYPCIRGFHFVNLFMADNSIYPSIVQAGKSGNTILLDLGCMLGTDLRKVIRDGYPASRVVGCDLRPEYIELGYQLFGDKETCPIKFIISNAFDLPDTPSGVEANGQSASDLDLSSITDLSQLRGQLTHIYTGALFHLFNKENQYGLAMRLALILKRTPGAVIFGRHQGLEQEGDIDDSLGRDRYGHSEASWAALWKKVFTEIEGEAFSQKVVVEARLTEGFQGDVFNFKKRSLMLYWSVRIA